MSKSRVQLLLIIAAFALPAVIALLMQTSWFHWNPGETRNRGELIEPVLPMTADAAANELFNNGKRWSVLVRFPDACAADCQRRLTLLSHIREAQGKKMERVQMVAWTSPQHPALGTVWKSWQPADSSPLSLAPGESALIDPLGNAMLRYAANAEPTDVRKDVAHLLRWSKVGE